MAVASTQALFQVPTATDAWTEVRCLAVVLARALHLTVVPLAVSRETVVDEGVNASCGDSFRL